MPAKHKTRTIPALRDLRVGARNAEGPPAAPEAKDADGDDGDDPDEDDGQEAHDTAAQTAADAYDAASAAALATMGNDSAALHQAGADAHDAAMSAGAAFKSSCIEHGGASDGAAPESQHAGAPPAPTGAAIARASTSPTAAAHLETATYAKLGRDVMQLLSAQSVDGALLKISAGQTALAKVGKLEQRDRAVSAAADLAARKALLADAVAQGVIPGRAQAFAIDTKGNVGAPLPSWSRGTVAELAETLATLGYKPGAPATASSTLIIADTNGESGLAARAAASGVDIETRRKAEANVNRQETSR